ncbi:conserved hypothetical protein [Streptomyces viridochromogenes DSM 40736]|uniref:DUF3592 domain-containing protein n=1 Tax=Streptomyces viridochromogenes (strain DSM 40736 / JCM 4977 / BCRC 1201 / Tue 494) TaxID=591159 RepID=D9XCB2_STRVT|nr:DUF3592 domain-containing protein [Streptomyces viridochromogenes]EFL32369.1 conserved hypothetical protein [Streptomyces viridochromogenes DSM 40736]
MEVLFYVVPMLMIAVASCAVVAVIRRSVRVGRAWSSGLTAEARCLRTYTTTSGGGDSSVHTTLHHVYAFTTRDGRGVRFEERGGPGTTLEGDIVTVHYPADRPEHATARPPTPGRLAAGTGCLLAFLGTFILFAVGFMAVTYAMFSAAGDFPQP